jgi:hypothetical protein
MINFHSDKFKRFVLLIFNDNFMQSRAVQIDEENNAQTSE